MCSIQQGRKKNAPGGPKVRTHNQKQPVDIEQLKATLNKRFSRENPEGGAALPPTGHRVWPGNGHPQ